MSTTTEEAVRPPKPTIAYRDDWADNISGELKALPQWVVWSYEWRDGREATDKSHGTPGKYTKIPYQPLAPAAKAKAGNPKTFGTFDQAVRAWQREPDVFAGVGFEFLPTDPYCGIDVDNCISADGEVAEWAQPHLDLLSRTRGDISPSGRGIKYIARAELPGTGTKKGGFGPDGSGAIEVYDRGRFFTICGNPTDEGVGIEDCQDVIDAIYAGLKSRPASAKPAAESWRPIAPLSIDDEELLRRARTAKSTGDKFSAVYDRGDISGFPSESEADGWLCKRLAFWAQKDAERMERLWLRSAIGQRGKTQERPDYRAMTILYAVENQAEVYNPGSRGRRSGEPSVNGKHSGGGQGVGVGVEAETPEEVEFRNWEWVEVEGEDGGEPKIVPGPIDQPAILESLASLTNGSVQRVGSVPFAHDGGDAEPVQFTNADQFFAYVAGRVPVSWRGGGPRYVPKRQFFEALRQSARQFDAIERHPHFPAIPSVYYACSPVEELGNGRALDGLLALYSPATENDRELIRAFAYTLFWGGPPGKRPLFISEGPEGDPLGGRGVGKSELFSGLADLVGGTVSNISARDDITAITKRIINDKARKRCVLLDNVKAERFSWGDFEGLITGSTVGAWLNYVGDEVRPNLMTYCMTINGASLSEDLAQRTVMIRLDRPSSYDRDGQAWSDVIARYIAENRREIIADVAAVFARPPAEIKAHQRWASWTHAVLARCANPWSLQNLILDRQDGINDDRAAARDFARVLARYLRSYLAQNVEYAGCFASQCGSDPNRAVVWISTDVLPPIVASFTEEKVSPLNVSKKINRFRPPELTKKDRTKGKGWLWVGKDADPASKEFKWIWPGDDDPDSEAE